MQNSPNTTGSGYPWKIFSQHIRMMIGLSLACAAGAAAFSWLQKATYRVSTYVLLSESKVETTQTTIPNYVYYEILRSYEAFAANDVLILKTIERLGLQKPPYSLTVEDFRRRRIIRVEWAKNTRLLEVSAEFTEPHLAAEIANSFVDGMVQLNEDLNAQDLKKARVVLKEQVNVCAQRLNSSREKLNEFDRSTNLEFLRQSLVDKLDLSIRNRRELARLMVERSRLRARQSVLHTEHEKGDADSPLKESGVEIQPPLSNAVIPTGQNRTQAFTRETAETRIELAGIDASIQTLTDSLESEDKVLAHLEREKASGEAIQRQLTDEYEAALSNYESFSRKYQEAALAVGARSTELKGVSLAIPPSKPYKPWVVLNTILGGLLGLLVSIPLSLLVHHYGTPAHRNTSPH